MTRIEFEHKQKDFFNFLLQERKATENTLRSYRADLAQFMRFWSLTEQQENTPYILASIFELFLKSLYNSAIGQSSIARKMSCFNSLKKFLKRDQITIPVLFKRPFVKPQNPVALNIEQIFHLMDSPNEDELPTKHPFRDKAIIELLYATGIHCSELVQIEIGNINFMDQSIIIRTKGKKDRLVFFGSKACERIKAYMHYERAEIKSSNERLFLNYRGTPITSRSIQRICAMFRQCFDTKQTITPCILRHSFAAHLLKNGADIETVQELMGHKTRASTERYVNKIIENT